MNSSRQCPATFAHMPHDGCDGKQHLPLNPSTTYRPPLETICTSCGGKHVGACSMNACNTSDHGARR